jgi:hypothetical protein
MLVADLRQTEVYCLNLWQLLILINNDEVLWLQVSMHNIKAVAVIDGLNNLLEYVTCLELIKELFLHDHVEELASLTELGDEVNILGIFEILVHFEDVRMIQSLEYLYLVLEPLTVLDLLPWNRFAGSDLLGTFVHNSVDNAVCPGTQDISLVHFVARGNRFMVFLNHR